MGFGLYVELQSKQKIRGERQLGCGVGVGACLACAGKAWMCAQM